MGHRTFLAMGSSFEIPQRHVTAYIIIYGHKKFKIDKFQIW